MNIKLTAMDDDLLEKPEDKGKYFDVFITEPLGSISAWKGDKPQGSLEPEDNPAILFTADRETLIKLRLDIANLLDLIY